MNLMIPMYLIKASIPCAAVNDYRKYINGALFEYTSVDKRLRVISTTGALLSCFSIHLPDYEEEDFSIIVPTHALKLAAKIKNQFACLRNFEGIFAFDNILFTPIDGKFPDYRRVIPDNLSGEAGNYQPELVLAAQNAMREFYQAKKQTFTMKQNGALGAAVIHNGFDDAMVVIMPVRVHSTDKPYINFA